MLESLAPRPALPTAGFRRRLLSLGYEALLLFAVLYCAAYAFSALLPGAQAGWQRNAFQVLLFVVGGGYFGWSWSAARRTLPMKTWHLRLVTRGGDPITWRRALMRYVLAWAAPALALGGYLALGSWGVAAAALPYAWAGLDPDRQFLHDCLAGTRLVDDRPRAVG